MYNMISMMMIISLIMMFLYLINFFLSMMKKMNREKNTPFECGFNPQSNARLPFSTQFFLITLMFLIFDIEIMLILPSIFLMKYKMLFLSICLMFFSIFMSISLMLEWMYSMLNWIF